MEAWRIHCLLNVQAIIDHAHQDVGHCADDAWPAWRPQDHKQLAIFQHDGRRHGAERTLARPNGVGFTLDQSISIRHAGFGSKVVHLIVEKKTKFAGGYGGAKAVRSEEHTAEL